LACLVIPGISQSQAPQPESSSPAVAPATVPDSPSKVLATAEGAFLYGNYQDVIREVSPLVDPKLILSGDAEIQSAYRILGLSHFFEEDENLATTYFEELIRRYPNVKLDPIQTPPPAINFFEAIKERLANELAAKRAELKEQAEAAERAKAAANTRVLETDYRINSRYVAMLPFGIGQFQNEAPLLGATFMATQLAGLSISIASFLAVENLRGADGRFRNADVDQARSFQRVQMLSGGLAIGLAVVGIVEAMVNYKPRRTLSTRERTGTTSDPTPTPTPTGLVVPF